MHWDHIIDDHNDTVAVLGAPDPLYVDDILGPEPVHDDGGPLWWLNGAAPATGSVMPDPRSFVVDLRSVLEELARPVREVIDILTPVVRDTWQRIKDAARDAINFITDLTGRAAERELSGPPPKPVRVDRSRVTHTSPRPPKPVHVYRRRTP